jgi:hypothetical protein
MYLRGPKQIPWDGKLEYDYQLWIDSDIVFTTEKFWQLCDMASTSRRMVRERISQLVGMLLKMAQLPQLLTG